MRQLTIMFVVFLISPVGLADQHTLNQMGQFSSLIDSQFKKFANSFHPSQSHRALAPGDPEDSLNVDVGIEITSAKIERDSFLEDYRHDDSSDTLYVPKFQLTTELSPSWNVGAFYSSVPDSDIQIYGGEFRYSMFEQNNSLPFLSVRGTFTQLTGVQDTFVTSRGLELAFSKGLGFGTPYAGFGTTWVDGEDQLAGYSETLSEDKYFLGMQFNLGMFTFAAETEQKGENSTTNAKFGVRF